MRILALASLLSLTAASAPDDARRFMVTGFDRIQVNGPFEVEIVTGASAASAEGDPAALDRLAVRVASGTLILGTRTAGLRPQAGDEPLIARVRIATPALRGLIVQGGAQVRVAEMRASRVDLSLDGAGSLAVAALRADEFHAGNFGMGMMTLAGTVGRARIQGALTAAVDATGLTANDATLSWASAGALTIAVRYTAQITASGAGPVAIIGKPYCTIRGTAPVTCEGRVDRR